MTLKVLASSIPSKHKQVEAVKLLQSWLDDDDDEEQKETGRYLIQALDEDRLSERQLFPPKLKSVSRVGTAHRPLVI